MHLYIYQADTKKTIKENKLEDLLSGLPSIFRERALRYKFEKDAFNFVLGRLLLKRGLEEFGAVEQLEDIKYQENDKPYLDTHFFNISHSEDCVICAISKDGRLGIDIEKIKPISLESFTTWFTDKEWEDIKHSENPERKFFWYWTRKESIIKALGVNLSYLHEIELDPSLDYFIDNGKKWHLKDIDFRPGYIGAVCSENIVIKQLISIFETS